MRRRRRSLGAFKPVLIEERGKRGMTELDLPENPEKRGDGLLMLARDAVKALCALRSVAIPGLRTRTEPEIDDTASRRRCQLEVRPFMEQHISLGLDANGGSVPAEVELRRTRANDHAQSAQERARLAVVTGRLRSARASEIPRSSDLP